MIGNVIPYHNKRSVKKILRRLMLLIISYVLSGLLLCRIHHFHQLSFIPYSDKTIVHIDKALLLPRLNNFIDGLSGSAKHKAKLFLR